MWIEYHFRRQKEKRINPSCASPPLSFSGCSNGDLGHGGSQGNMYTASLSSLPTSTQNTLTSLHPLALVGAGLSNVARAVNAASSHWVLTTSSWFSKKSSIDLIFTPILPLSYGEHWSIKNVPNIDFLRYYYYILRNWSLLTSYLWLML